MINNSLRQNSLWIIIVPCYAVLLSLTILQFPAAGFALSVFPLLLSIVLQKPKIILFLLLFSLPFQSIPFLAQNLAGIPGAKVTNILAAGALIVLFMQETNPLNAVDSIKKKTSLVLLLYFIVFTIAFFRSTEYLSLLHNLMPEQFESSWIRYTLSFYIKPALYLIGPLIILKRFRSQNELDMTINVLLFSVFLLSCCIILVTTMHLGEFLQGRNMVRELCETYFGMHYNSLGTIIIVCGPLMMLKAIDRHSFWIFNIVVTFAALLILQSRSALLSFIFSNGLLFLFLKRKKTLIFSICLLIMIYLIIPEQMMKGYTSGVQKSTADAFLSGRISHLWLPLLKEWLSNPYNFFWGTGLFGLMTSPLWSSGFLVQATHAHNAYLDFFLNSGIIIFCLLIFFIFINVKKAWQLCRKMNSSLCWAIFSSIIAYLVAGVSGRNFYPHSDNMLLLPLIAIFVNLVRLYKAKLSI